MIDKFLKIGLGLGAVSTIGSIVYWGTQYEKHMPFYAPKSISKVVVSKRLSNKNYLKIKEIEEQVGCNFLVIVDGDDKAYSLLKEEKVTDEILENLSEQFDKDKDSLKNEGDILTVANLQKQCKLYGAYRKTLRISLEKITEAEDKVSFQYKSRTNNQGGRKFVEVK